VLDWIRSRARKRRIAQDIYGSIVAQARSEAFYRGMGVPDTVMGRLEMIILHTALLIERLQLEGEAGDRLAQDVAEAYVADMDDSIREIGIGDMVIGKHMGRAMQALGGRLGSYREALAADADPALLSAALARNVLRGEDAAPDWLGARVREEWARCTARPLSEILG